ncbi:MAG: ethanolamine ammonia-lyase subunit EutC [Acidobacteriaceae bacterium]
MTKPAAPHDPWHPLTRFTKARIALGRIGASLPTRVVLDFAMAHAQARDAVHLPFDSHQLSEELRQAHFDTLQVHSQAANRNEYLLRPDLGRQLHPSCHTTLASTAPAPTNRLTIVIADGLSSLAPICHAAPFLKILRPLLTDAWDLDHIIVAAQARVAIGDEIGAIRRAEACAVLIGERPGLSSSDSLGIYLTYAPYTGRTDAERNCISNIRPAGLPYAQAAQKLVYLLQRARLLGESGIALKDNSEIRQYDFRPLS